MRALYYLTFTAIVALVSGSSSDPLDLIYDELDQVVDEGYKDYLGTNGKTPPTTRKEWVVIHPAQVVVWFGMLTRRHSTETATTHMLDDPISLTTWYDTNVNQLA